MLGTASTTGRCAPAWPKDALRIGFGVIWLIDAVLKWLPGFRSAYMSTIMGTADGQPGWLKPWFNLWINLQHPRALWFLGNPTSVGMHAGTLSFTAGTPGHYRYLCPVPGHAQKGMTGTFTVT